jgi:ABC-2 type transport system ATP-binding protein
MLTGRMSQSPASPAAIDAMLRVQNVSKRHGRLLALDGVTFDVQRGERFALLGPNGAGKTTLTHAICTIERVDGGSITIDGIDVRRRPRAARARLGVVFQEPSLDTRLTVFENLEFHGRVFGVRNPLRRKRIDEALALVSLADVRDRVVRTLSRGMQRRLEIARVLVHDAGLLILDEPTVGLDPQSRAGMWEHLRALQRDRGLTVLVSTHYVDEVDDADRVCILDRGRVLALDAPAALKAEHGEASILMVPRDDARAELSACYPNAVFVGDALRLPLAAGVDVAAVLAAFGTRLHSFTIETPTLEHVFLDLTGRALRDGSVAPQRRGAPGSRVDGGSGR